jgi:hypothetical protein
MTTMRPKWSTVSQLRPNRPLRALSKGAMSSTGARHRPLRSLILLTLLSATLAVGLVSTATAATGSQQALAAATTTTTWPTLRYGARGTAVVYLQQRRPARSARAGRRCTTTVRHVGCADPFVAAH